MITATDLKIMKTRRNAAKNALRFFKEKRSIKSTNNPFAFVGAAGRRTLDAYRAAMIDDQDASVVRIFTEAANAGIGNCTEKGMICYASLYSNPTLQRPDHVVTLCEAIGYDHVFLLVTSVRLVGSRLLSNFGTTMMVLDGWTEDWYFPNLGFFDAKTNGLGNNPNPRQAFVRAKIASHSFKEYNDGDFELNHVQPTRNSSPFPTNNHDLWADFDDDDIEFYNGEIVL